LKHFLSKVKNGLFTSDEPFGFDLSYFVKNGFWVLLSQLAEILAGVLLSVVFARFASKEIYGQYNFLFSIFAMFSIVSIPGFRNALVRSVARGYDGVYQKSTRLSLLWSLAGLPFMVLIGAYYFHEGDRLMALSLFAAAVLLPLYYAPVSWSAALQGKAKFNYRSILLIIQLTVNALSIILAILYAKENLLLLFMANIASMALLNVIYYFWVKARFVNNNRDDKIWKQSGYKLSIIPFVSNVYSYLDKIMIGLLLGNEALAVYSIATAIAGKLTLQQKQILSIVQPKLYGGRTEKRLFRFSPKYFMLSTGFSVIVVLFLPYLMDLFYGEKYAESVIYAQLYMICFPLAGLAALFNSILIALNKINEIVTARLSALAVNIVLYVLLIPLFEMYGAIAASAAYYAVTVLLFYVFIGKEFK
jgi:O-antigen/teichoic acid export membrane protein